MLTLRGINFIINSLDFKHEVYPFLTSTDNGGSFLIRGKQPEFTGEINMERTGKTAQASVRAEAQ